MTQEQFNKAPAHLPQLPHNVGLGAAGAQCGQSPSYPTIQLRAARMDALRLAFDHVKGGWQEAIRAARDILAFLEDG